MKELIKIRPFVDDDFKELEENAKSDQHSGVYCPTEVEVKDDKIVGYLSIGIVPLVLTWQDRGLVGPVDSSIALGYVLGATRAYKHICFPCDPESPFHKSGFLEKAGFVQYTKPVILYIKQ